MNKAQLIDDIVSEMSLEYREEISKAQVNKLLSCLSVATYCALQEYGEVTLPGIAKLTTSERAERKGRNPQTGEEITIPAVRVVKFKPLKALKDVVNY